jgi:LuxR family maltose regulon positive regulatory protein
MHVGLSEVLVERRDLSAAAQHLQASAELGEPAGLPQHAYRWRVATARLRQAHGDLEGALELLEAAEPLYNTDYSPAVRPVSALTARVQLRRGDLDAATRFSDDRGLSADDELSYLREFEHITLAEILLGRHAAGHGQSLERAIDLLDRLRVAADTGQRNGSSIEILVLLARAHHARNDLVSARNALDEALVRAQPEGYVRPFLDGGPTIVALLRSDTGSGVAADHARRVLAATDAVPPITPSRSGLVDDLSARELDVLRLLRTDLSGPDIASELIVSLNTVRSHTKSIYSKLGVNNRREAIRRADELGL